MVETSPKSWLAHVKQHEATVNSGQFLFPAVTPSAVTLLPLWLFSFLVDLRAVHSLMFPQPLLHL